MRSFIWLIGLLLMTHTCQAANDYTAATHYKAPWWQPSGHLQTIMPYLFPSSRITDYTRQRWELDDGDFVDADWTEPPETIAENTPTLVLFHGLEGSSDSHYARTLMRAARRHGWLGVVIHFRGCSGTPNRLPRVYYAGDSVEIERLLTRVNGIRPHAPLYAVGVSLGGNALLKWLGERAPQSHLQLQSAAAVSAPVALADTAHSLDQGLNYWLYSRTFVSTMQPKALQMAERFPDRLQRDAITRAKTVQDMDNAVTAVLFGAKDAEDYYQQNAAMPWLRNIRTPTLMLNAQNDPFVPYHSLPTSAQVSSFVTLDYPFTGGHAGFDGEMQGSGHPWLGEYLLQQLQTLANRKFPHP